jgi:hypothetical protein
MKKKINSEQHDLLICTVRNNIIYVNVIIPYTIAYFFFSIVIKKNFLLGIFLLVS